MKKMTISKIDHNYGKIDNVSEILAGPFVCVKCLYLNAPKIVFQRKTY